MSGPSFLGRGWRFPIQPDASGSLGYIEAEANIEQSLKILLLTSLGERVMRPTFGCAVPRLVFAPGSVQYMRLLETSIREAVRDWEPRIALDNVAAEAMADDETRVNVNIEYRIRGSNTKFNLVFPFYLGQVQVAQ